jgi:hypothetical protein
MSGRVPRYCVPQGVRDPHPIELTIVAGTLIQDTSLVTALALVGRDIRSSEPITWNLTEITAQSAAAVTFRRRYAAADTAIARGIRFVAWATLTGAANPIQCGVFDLYVEGP